MDHHLKTIKRILLLTSVLLSLTFSANVFAAEASDNTDEDILQPQHGIPLVIVNIDESPEAIAAAQSADPDHIYGNMDAMNNSNDHSVRCVGSVEIRLPEGYSGPEVPTGELKLSFIRGRGNSTWSSPKKPYRFKLDKKQDLFGMGASKDWALMANYNDDTLLHNTVTSWLGKEMEMPFTPESVPVDLVMANSSEAMYLGCYTLSETVKVEDSRVAIDELSEDPEADAPEQQAIDITGGFLFSIYNSYQDDDPSSNYFTTKNNIQFRNISPEYMSEDLTKWQNEHRNYIRKYIQNVEDLIVDSETIDQETHDQIANLLDLKSVADYYLVQEFSRNGDAYGTNSTYLYKPRSGKLCFGPLWDFDIAYGTLGENDDVNESYHSLNNTHMLWIDELRNKDPEFVSIINERWSVMKDALDRLTASGGELSKMSEYIRASYIANRELWYKSSDYPFDPDENPDYRPDYDEIFDENINDFSRWLIARKNWINENISNFDKVFATVTYIVDEEVYHTDDHVYIDEYCNSPIKGPDKENYIFEGWYSEDGVSLSDYIINEDTSFYARYISYEDAIAPQAIYLSKTEDWVEVGSIYNKLLWATVYPDDATSSDISWKSNDESIAIVEGEGTVSAISEGTVTIQGFTYNGVTTEFILHVYDPDKVEPVQPEGITVGEEEPVIIEVNETRQLEWNFIPADKPVLYEYANSFCNNDDTIILDQNHVVTGIAPGEATIEISAYYKDQTIISKTITVRVVEKKDSDDKKDADGKGSSGENKDSGKTNVSKKANTLKVKGKTLTISYKKLKKKSRTFARKKLITVSKAKGKVTYKKVGVSKVTNNKYGIKYFTDPNKQYGKKFSVNPKTGKITVKKGLRKGTYKLRIKVTAAGNSSYKSKTKTVTLKIKVK